ncbi:unnamed protein product [Sphenostylis stenocarpa]|uniref:Uncharacterized protein n=1 Tax=Sphenostylis stenocarpa TaxID=92480 RepID=A0AA86S759_9FABA|nr:unnamed protein product [Sphenostylis stenocarpa]
MKKHLKKRGCRKNVSFWRMKSLSSDQVLDPLVLITSCIQKGFIVILGLRSLGSPIRSKPLQSSLPKSS